MWITILGLALLDSLPVSRRYPAGIPRTLGKERSFRIMARYHPFHGRRTARKHSFTAACRESEFLISFAKPTPFREKIRYGSIMPSIIRVRFHFLSCGPPIRCFKSMKALRSSFLTS